MKKIQLITDKTVISEKFDSWSVDVDGNLICEALGYFIQSDRLTENNWILHYSNIKKVNLNDFFPAYLHALEIMKIKEITFKTGYY